MAVVTICSDFGAQGKKILSFSLPPLFLHLPWSDGTGCHDLRFLNVEFYLFIYFSGFIPFLLSGEAVAVEDPLQGGFHHPAAGVRNQQNLRCASPRRRRCSPFAWMLSFKPAFSLSSFNLIKRLFSSYLLSAIRVVSSAYLRLLIFLPEILIPACNSSSPAFHMMHST